MVDQDYKSPSDSEPRIMTKKYITPTPIASLCVEIIICNCAFSENH
jgi:hypothetical protein